MGINGDRTLAATCVGNYLTMAMTLPQSANNLAANDLLISQIRDYWNENIHDLEIATQPVGSAEFFYELDAYRFEKLNYLPALIDFSAFSGKQLLEVGCGVGTDLVHFARGGANVTGVDLCEVSVDLARQNFRHNQLTGNLQVMNGEALAYEDSSFDVVYCHGVLGYTASATRMVSELHRVLRSGGQGIMMVYNKYSWLNALSKIMKVELEHEDAPVLTKYSISEFQKLLDSFAHVRIIPERFPVKTRLHHGLKGTLFNDLFVGAYNSLPRALVRPTGWHLMAFATKS
jgi:2-polyprenyl-3-methyl-5-hydroxy-6-metoxy-1,4-benzoquinol methylase